MASYEADPAPPGAVLAVGGAGLCAAAVLGLALARDAALTVVALVYLSIVFVPGLVATPFALHALWAFLVRRRLVRGVRVRVYGLLLAPGLALAALLAYVALRDGHTGAAYGAVLWLGAAGCACAVGAAATARPTA